MKQNIEDYELMPIQMLVTEANEAVTRQGGLLSIIQMGAEAEARLPIIPKVEGVFEEQRTQLKGVLDIANKAIDESRLSEDALRLKPDKSGY